MNGYIILNLILLVVNAIDINWVWFNFEWNGEYLKDFVHKATNILILSILISIALVLYFFRGNINFLKDNNKLKWLSYIWLFQNAVLTISVAIRNIYYIQYFTLAYKRIGVILFLILTLYGLYTVFLKVKKRKTPWLVFSPNTRIRNSSGCLNFNAMVGVFTKHKKKHGKQFGLHHL